MKAKLIVVSLAVALACWVRRERGPLWLALSVAGDEWVSPVRRLPRIRSSLWARLLALPAPAWGDASRPRRRGRLAQRHPRRSSDVVPS